MPAVAGQGASGGQVIPVAAPGAWLGLTDEVSGPVGLAGQLWQSGPLVCMPRLFWDDLQGESKKALRLIKHSLFFLGNQLLMKVNIHFLPF